MAAPPSAQTAPLDMAEHPYRFADALNESRDVLELAFSRVVAVITAQATTSRTHQVAPEVLDEEREHEEPGGIAVTEPAVHEDEWRPLSLNPPCDLRAVVRDRHMDLLFVHDPPPSRSRFELILPLDYARCRDGHRDTATAFPSCHHFRG